MILVDKDIHEALERGSIVIKPFDPKRLGCNSYDCTLGKNLLVYTNAKLDAKKDNPCTHLVIPEDGYELQPGIVYLAVTEQYTETHEAVPFIEGRSSVGRLGIQGHCTAGRGGISFTGHWTLEIIVTQPVRVYAGMPTAQLIYFKASGVPKEAYNKKVSAKYNGQYSDNPMPMSSKFFKNFETV